MQKYLVFTAHQDLTGSQYEIAHEMMANDESTAVAKVLKGLRESGVRLERDAVTGVRPAKDDE